MNIGQKFTAGIISVVLVIGFFSAYLYYRIEMVNETKRLEMFGSTIGSVLEEHLKTYMITRDFDVLDKEMHNLKGIRPINKILLINREGIIKAGTDEKTIGTKLADIGLQYHRYYDEAGKTLIFRDKGIFQLIQPIKNRPECYRCHDYRIKNNGFFMIDFSLKESEKHVRQNIYRGILILLLSILSIGAVTIMLSNSILTKRLKRMTDNIKYFKNGDYSAMIPVDKKDEITELERVLNDMAVAIKDRDSEKSGLLADLKITLGKISSSQKMWEDTFDSIGDLISIHDSDFNIIKANRAFSEYFGLDPKEVINKKCYEFFHTGDSVSPNCPHIITMGENRPVTVEIQDIETHKIFLISTFPFYFHDAQFRGSIHIAKDVTEERDKEMRLIMTERLAALGQMASGIAHEINNPLAAIAGCTEGLLSRVEKEKYDPELFKNYLKIIEEEILRCKGITTSMLSFARKAIYEKKAINISEILDKTLDIIGFQGRLKEVNVKKNYKEGLPVIYGSEGELRQVLLSIVTNALDAMEDKGILTIETDIMPSIEKGGDGGSVTIKIADNGPGIPIENIPRIFDPFFTTKSEKGGTGLGLSIARKIISNHGGSIDLVSETGKGATFRIMLPIQI